MYLRMIICLFLLTVGFAHAESQPARPNIIVIMCDDLGYGDLACYGHKIIETPHLDKLAANGIRFTDGYTAAPVCSPARAGLMTGRNPYRAGIYDWIPSGVVHLQAHEITFAKRLKEAGYRTILSGKWHLNGHFNRPDKQPTPGDHGFDHWFATKNNASPNHENPRNFVRNGKPVGIVKGYSSSIVVSEVLNWLDNSEDKSKPFLGVLTFHEPHTPVASPKDLIDKYMPHQTVHGQAIYWANVAQVDRAVGELVSGLKARQLTENTLIVFTSDNGPEEWMRYPGCRLQHGSVGPLRGYKLDIFEGGIRVPYIVSWPGNIKPGVSNTPVSSLDLFPTFCKLAGAAVPENHELDGMDLTELLINGKASARKKPLFWFYYAARGYANFALRDGDYSMIGRRTGELFYPGRGFKPDQFTTLKDSRPRNQELYDLGKDSRQTIELKSREPNRYNTMKKQLDDAWSDLREDLVDWEKVEGK